MHLTASEVASATGGQLSGPDVDVDGASIDSRTIGAGNLFVPVVAERDGHDFIQGALDKGAVAYLTEREPLPGTTAIRVADTQKALADLGRHARSRIDGPVVGVTGSVGKTSTKDLLAAVLSTTFVTAANERSFNNELGLPLTLLNAPDDTQAAVVEMGARGIGHIALLCDIAHPSVGVVTRVAGVHLELFGSIDDVAQAKGELIESLPSDGLAVLNADDPRVIAMASRSSAPVISYGIDSSGAIDEPADVYVTDITVGDDLRAAFTLHTPWGQTPVQLSARGAHQVSNALAAAAVAGGLGVGIDAIAAGLGAAQVSALRMELVTTPDGTAVINDAYNANPTSMKAALDALASLPATGRRVAVLGVMAELGADGAAEHAQIAADAAQRGIEVIAVDCDAYGAQVTHVADIDGALAALGELTAADVVLVKGSRVAALERVAAALLGAQ